MPRSSASKKAWWLANASVPTWRGGASSGQSNAQSFMSIVARVLTGLPELAEAVAISLPSFKRSSCASSRSGIGAGATLLGGAPAAATLESDLA